MMIAELERRTREEFGAEPATHLDYAELVLSSGGSIMGLAEDISEKIGQKIYRETLSKYLNGLAREASEDTLERARARGAHAKAEKAELIAATSTKDTAAADALHVRALQWSAERMNPQAFGQQKGVNVSISIGGMHLDSLRRRNASAVIVTADVPSLPSGGESDEASDVQVIEAQEVTSE